MHTQHPGTNKKFIVQLVSMSGCDPKVDTGWTVEQTAFYCPVGETPKFHPHSDEKPVKYRVEVESPWGFCRVGRPVFTEWSPFAFA
jgi:hypothetical protein